LIWAPLTEISRKEGACSSELTDICPTIYFKEKEERTINLII